MDEIAIFFLFILALVILIAYWIRVGRAGSGAIAVDDSPSEAVDAVGSAWLQ